MLATSLRLLRPGGQQTSGATAGVSILLPHDTPPMTNPELCHAPGSAARVRTDVGIACRSFHSLQHRSSWAVVTSPQSPEDCHRRAHRTIGKLSTVPSRRSRVETSILAIPSGYHGATGILV